MTTIAVGLDEGADFHQSSALDPFKDLRELLPRLAQPSWVRLISNQRELSKTHHAPSADAQRIIDRKARKRSRLARALAGEHTRVRAHATA